MGVYINPEGESKEAFLERVAERIFAPLPPAFADLPVGKVVVCLVDNGMFTAAAVADTQREIDRFVHGMSGRPHSWWLIDKAIAMSAVRGAVR